MRLTRNRTAAEDLVQETYLRAYRSWDQFDRGTNCRSWLFTICRHTHLHEQERASTRYELVESEIREPEGAATARPFMDQHAIATGSADDFLKILVDEELVAAIDALPGDFREVLSAPRLPIASKS